jgi:hypothetical protein
MATDDSSLQQTIAGIGARFALEGEFVSGEEIVSGHINTTYRAAYATADGSVRRYILQRINGHVFKDPAAVMSNVARVTRHIGGKVASGAQTLRLFPARDGASWTTGPDGGVWRCYNCLEGCVTHDVVETPEQAYQAARAFGAFQELVSDLPAGELAETIPDFHDTRKRFARLLEVAAADPYGRLETARREFEFILAREADAGRLLGLHEAGEIPLRVIHNDTKINNVMVDTATGEAVCVIDLDTVMPGLSLYDFGDLVRSSVSPAAEDETDLSKVEMRMPVFEALVVGFLSTAGDFLNDVEIEHLAFAGKLLTFEVGIRFLTDFLEGDVYFKTHRPGHNLDRCRNQLALVARMEEREVEMRQCVAGGGKSRRLHPRRA